MLDPVAEVVALFDGAASALYGNERVTQRAHALQSAMLAEQDGAAAALVAAALLHDIGHLLAAAKHPDMGQHKDDLHEKVGAGWLARRFVDAVADPVRLHVDAKRYLCQAEPGYAAILSPASVRSLELQGGTFSADEAAAYRALPHAGDAIRLRRWDDLAKVPDAPTRALADYEPLLRGLLRTS
jgi:[1-hydroxy-2-(trimethylamino)ethyl]phosphonate dioxygenase